MHWWVDCEGKEESRKLKTFIIAAAADDDDYVEKRESMKCTDAINIQVFIILAFRGITKIETDGTAYSDHVYGEFVNAEDNGRLF